MGAMYLDVAESSSQGLPLPALILMYGSCNDEKQPIWATNVPAASVLCESSAP